MACASLNNLDDPVTPATKESVAIAILRAAAMPKRVLSVLRPQHPDDPLGGLWGLPAATLRPGETIEDTLTRAMRKVGLHWDSNVAVFASGSQDREDHVLNMTLYAVDWSGREPSVGGNVDKVISESETQYDAWKWAAPDELHEAAGRGSLCARLFLGASGL